MTQNKFSIEDILKARSEQLSTALGVKLGHSVSQGDLSEGQWIDFLKSFLPNRYDVTKGFVFDSKGGISEQIDLIIFDPHHSPLIYQTSNGERYVTAESVYAVFEVKQKANKRNIEYADAKIRSVTDLARTSRQMISSGKKVPAREPVRILGGLLATDSVSPDVLEGHIMSSSVDIVCSVKKGTFHRVNGEVMRSSGKESIFTFFFLLLDELYKLGTTGAIDIRDYADQSLSSFKLTRGEI